MTAPSRHLCLFDLDHTLIPIDSDHAFGSFMVEIGWADADEFRRRNDAFYADYQAGTLDLDAYIDFATSVWRQRPLAEALAARERFLAEVLRPRVTPQALELVRHHQRRGDLVAIVTATNEFVTTPIAAEFGVEHLLAVDAEVEHRKRSQDHREDDDDDAVAADGFARIGLRGGVVVVFEFRRIVSLFVFHMDSFSTKIVQTGGI